MFQEANIQINGHSLTPAQAMTIRVALQGFQREMSEEDALGDDQHGRDMAHLYRDRASEINSMILSST